MIGFFGFHNFDLLGHGRKTIWNKGKQSEALEKPEFASSFADFLTLYSFNQSLCKNDTEKCKESLHIFLFK